jgi:hypothetical protein
LPLHPECVPFLARLGAIRRPGAPSAVADDGPLMEPVEPGDGGLLIGHPPAEPSGLLAAARAELKPVRAVRQAARAWLSIPGQGEGLLIAVTVADPASDLERTAAAEAIERAAASVPLRVPFPVHVIFPGEPTGCQPPDPVDSWIAANTRPFYVTSSPPA